MLSLLFSWIGISLTTVALGVLAFLAFTRGWLHVAIGLAVLAALFAYSGVLVQVGEGICEERVERAIKRVEEARGKIIDDVTEGMRARADRAEAESTDSEQRAADYEREITRRIAEAGKQQNANSDPPDCDLDQFDVDSLRAIAR